MRGEAKPLSRVPFVLIVAVLLWVTALAVAALSMLGTTAVTAGGDPHAPCSGAGAVTDIEPTADQNTATYDASPNVVTGVCIKAGTMFNGEHAFFDEDTSDIEDCYTITGIGTSSVTVQRTGTPGSACQGISHIDVLTGPPPPTPTTPAETPSPTPTEEAPSPTPTVESTSEAGSTPTAVLGEVQGPSALPTTGGSPAGSGTLALLLVALVLMTLGSGAALATVLVRTKKR